MPASASVIDFYRLIDTIDISQINSNRSICHMLLILTIYTDLSIEILVSIFIDWLRRVDCMSNLNQVICYPTEHLACKQGPFWCLARERRSRESLLAGHPASSNLFVF